MQKQFKIVVLLSFVLSFLLITPLLAQTIEKSKNNTVGGIKELKNGFQVFPEGKLGNTLYKDKNKLISRDDLVLHDIVEAPEGHIYYGTNELNEPVLGFVGNTKVQFVPLEGGFYQLQTESGLKRIFRLNPQNEIQNVLPNSNTASGLVYNGENKAAFFHITKGETIETEDEGPKFQYTFRIHVVKDGDDKIIHLPETVSDFKSKLKLIWIDRNTLQYTLSNNQKETIVIN
ncbi:hypothetical protein KJ966_12170 [bacterium]|nr:hypothetical protein [bacterium]